MPDIYSDRKKEESQEKKLARRREIVIMRLLGIVFEVLILGG